MLNTDMVSDVAQVLGTVRFFNDIMEAGLISTYFNEVKDLIIQRFTNGLSGSLRPSMEDVVALNKAANPRQILPIVLKVYNEALAVAKQEQENFSSSVTDQLYSVILSYVCLIDYIKFSFGSRADRAAVNTAKIYSATMINDNSVMRALFTKQGIRELFAGQGVRHVTPQLSQLTFETTLNRMLYAIDLAWCCDKQDRSILHIDIGGFGYELAALKLVKDVDTKSILPLMRKRIISILKYEENHVRQNQIKKYDKKWTEILGDSDISLNFMSHSEEQIKCYDSDAEQPINIIDFNKEPRIDTDSSYISNRSEASSLSAKTSIFG